jgi:hypothetical protein
MAAVSKVIRKTLRNNRRLVADVMEVSNCKQPTRMTLFVEHQSRDIRPHHGFSGKRLGPAQLLFRQ